jgi:hypothetical protein
MNLLAPLALLFALLAIPIILLYLLRLQRREQPVSSTMLWRQSVMDREANTLWQKLRRNLLLLLQLLTLLFLVFALIRPYINVQSQLTGKVTVLLDASASMLAQDGAGSATRFETAKAEARKLVGQLGANDQMTLVLVNGTPRVISASSNDQSQLLSALDRADATLSTANWSAAISLAAGLGGDNNTVIVISDGAHADDLQLLQGQARYVPIGSSSDNVAISTFALRQTVRGLSAFVRVNNYGKQNDEVLVSLKSDSDGALLDARTLKIPAGQSATWTVNNIDSAITTLRATLDQAQHNVLPVDDVAYAVNVNNTTRRALLLTRGNRFLEQALSAMPNLRTTRSITLPAASERPYDLYVLDNMTMTLPANASALVIGAQAVFSASGSFSNTAYVRADSHPVLQSVDWRNVNLLDARHVSPPQNLKALVQSQGGPVLFAGENVAMRNLALLKRVVYLPFELRRSDLPLQIAFPILIANSVDWLAPPQGLNVPANAKPGDVIALPEGALVQAPGQQAISVDRRGFAQTERAGIYGFRTTADETAVNGAFAVNFFNPVESDIAPNAQLQIGSATAAANAPTQRSQHEFWNIMAIMALLLLLAEWWVYQRGIPVRISQQLSSSGASSAKRTDRNYFDS